MAISFTTLLRADETWTAAKKGEITCPTLPQVPLQPLLTTPFPVRKIRLPQIGTKAFQLPNGVQADLNVDLQTILGTAVASSPVFSPTDPTGEDPCNSHIELRSAVTTFQLDLVEVGGSFGFSPAGSIDTISSMKGDAKVKVGAIAMDFSLWHCGGGNCSAVAAVTSNHTVAGGNISFDMDFGAIKTSAGLVFNPALGATLRSIMVDGIKQLSASPRLAELDWTATVQNFNPVSGVLTLSAGDRSRLLPNQTFEVYAPTDTTAQGVCNVWQTVAYIHTSTVHTASSEAVLDQIFDPRGVQKGDVVMVRTVRPGH